MVWCENFWKGCVFRFEEPFVQNEFHIWPSAFNMYTNILGIVFFSLSRDGWFNIVWNVCRIFFLHRNTEESVEFIPIEWIHLSGWKWNLTPSIRLILVFDSRKASIARFRNVLSWNNSVCHSLHHSRSVSKWIDKWLYKINAIVVNRGE